MQKTNWEELVEKNFKAILAAVAVILVLVGFGFLWTDHAAKQEKAADALFYQAQTKARALALEKKPEEAVHSFDDLKAKFAGSRATYEAELQIGDIWMDAAKPEEASKSYESAIQLSKDPFSKILAHYSLGISLESAGKYQLAVDTYEKIAKEKKFDFLQPEILMAMARCHEKLNQKELAIGLYKEIQEKFSTRTFYSGAASVYEKNLTQSPN